ncbi:MAG: alpha-L-glutamate ligase-like protein [Candidatus Tectomicrobia bacterium RIFCSPLOWO2_12_FULL_69_37]|nr:MAG: alpha-L-glutamate ligase-like protein [Candidatus Tectomicrobia bacterium RIFCSPLOWO2_02_FULL_70_19]OGL66101.1 MAG: alpha-L-glutamate ligase-like protein [Candidatus Tectomicrobia bacterium RIFCSPLOWO2_12_FULL_69_37]
MAGIWRAARELRAAGVLGMNRRNADYIMARNPRSRFPLVDDKILTARLAEEHGVPTPAIYRVIEHHAGIAGFERGLQGDGAFAVKPSHGAGGMGIVLVERTGEGGFFKPNGALVPREALYHHISNILSGVYSLAGQPDQAIIQALIRPDNVFERVSWRGVPDIRVVVYRGVPVMAMTRLPTKASDGKANLHGGAIGAGIGIGDGRTRHAVHRSRPIDRHPDTGNPLDGVEVPHWDRILLASARAFEMTGLGYLGVDQVLDWERGPVLLELNARPGLAIQIANRTGLWGRLEQADQAPAGIFATPEARVAWARQAFPGGR